MSRKVSNDFFLSAPRSPYSVQVLHAVKRLFWDDIIALDARFPSFRLLRLIHGYNGERG